ncbi:MAG: ABC transporter ATP-binding protein [Clostridia bacterium]|nr:ABC transporter ATP-binding protein [Clostridia bacterium]
MSEYQKGERILEVKDLELGFNTYAGQVQALRGVDFYLNKGETLAIVGESGSGKSVTIKAVTKLLAANAVVKGGSITYKGQDILNMDDKQFSQLRGNEISLIFQDPLSSLDPVMRIGKQITETLRLKLKMSKEEAKKRAIELMGAVGIPEPEKRYNEYPFQFSGGMRQRIVIAIALACNPEVLICDEPTTALDVTIQSQILELIGDIQRKNNLSVIFITHDLGVVANVADRVCVMYAGKIVETGTVEEIFYDPRHPYTWSLLTSMPSLATSQDDKLTVIPGTPPNMVHPPKGDAFAARNPYALKIDFEEQPPMFKISDTHYAATWLEHPDAPKMGIPEPLKSRIAAQLAREVEA